MHTSPTSAMAERGNLSVEGLVRPVFGRSALVSDRLFMAGLCLSAIGRSRPLPPFDPTSRQGQLPKWNDRLCRHRGRRLIGRKRRSQFAKVDARTLRICEHQSPQITPEDVPFPRLTNRSRFFSSCRKPRFRNRPFSPNFAPPLTELDRCPNGGGGS